MNPESPSNSQRQASILRNWLSASGLVIGLGGLFSFFLLFLIDTLAHSSNPYIGLLTYIIAPGFMFFGIGLVAAGAIRQRRKYGIQEGWLPKLTVDLADPRDRRRLIVIGSALVAFLMLSALGSYQTYHYTESVVFCGQACHQVMHPELTTYQKGVHSRVACVDCHIGPGATWFVKSKLSGTYQLYAVAFNKYPRPVPTPIKNLRPAQETCEQCHWPQKFVGNLERTYHYYLNDASNSPFTVRMVLKVGGTDPSHGPVGGIHYHMNEGRKIDYLATDEGRQKIPWVRLTDAQGEVTEFKLRSFTNAVDESKVRRMDCMDCHNHPAHRYKTPDAAVSLAMNLDKVDASLPFVKTNAIMALTAQYTNVDQALRGIETYLTQRYAGAKGLPRTVEAVQQIYKDYFFPEMNATWRSYPDNIGHKDWPGCFRCHDDSHKSADGKRKIPGSDCNVCHTILAQGSGADLDKVMPKGQKFKHPADDVDGDCNSCHNGGLEYR
jgi:nitrate/TMAO reductase-like tetraheme cytochrome c subunit